MYYVKQKFPFLICLWIQLFYKKKNSIHKYNYVAIMKTFKIKLTLVGQLKNSEEQKIKEMKFCGIFFL